MNWITRTVGAIHSTVSCARCSASDFGTISPSTMWK